MLRDKKHSYAQFKVKRSIENNLNKNTEAVSLIFIFVKKVFLKKFHNIYTCAKVSLKVAFFSPAFYRKDTPAQVLSVFNSTLFCRIYAMGTSGNDAQ